MSTRIALAVSCTALIVGSHLGPSPDPGALVLCVLGYYLGPAIIAAN